MPQDNWHKNVSTSPGFIPAGEEAKYGEGRFTGQVRGFIPDPNKKPIVLTPEQEVWGVNGRPERVEEGKIGIPRRPDEGTLRPNGETRPMPKGKAKKE